jgi:pimeloyl-ACP methyl ester carboxylesterase
VSVFSLVHGGQHGAWCWAFVMSELRRRGHEAIAVDLPIEDPTAGAARYAEVVAASLQDAGDDVIIVGHSLGGLTIPIVASMRPARRLVFVCAGYPEPGRSHFDALAAEPHELLGPLTRANLAESSFDPHLDSPEVARAIFYSDCSRELQDWAIPQLRPQSRTPHGEISPLKSWPETPRTLIHTVDDRAIPLALARRRTRRLFGEDPIVIPGGHSPFLSRPAELADLLTDAAAP